MSNTPSCFDGRCNWCQKEKIRTMLHPDSGKLLNQRCELIARFRYGNKFKL